MQSPAVLEQGWWDEGGNKTQVPRELEESHGLHVAEVVGMLAKHSFSLTHDRDPAYRLLDFAACRPCGFPKR
jgi:hypothetical protein